LFFEKIWSKYQKLLEKLVLSVQGSGVVKRGEPETSVSDNDWYIRAVRGFLKNEARFNRFKRSPVYREVLEHVSYSQAKEYIQVIEQMSPSFLTDERIRLASANDLVGNPVVFSFDMYGRISGPTLRYLKVCAELDSLFNLKNVSSIAEIGGGYGGQALVYNQIFEFDNYLIFDLAPVCELINKYLNNYFLAGGVEAIEINQFPRNAEAFDLVISNYAFSELPKKLQKIYLDKVLLRARRGYLTMNTGYDLKGFRRESKINCSELLEMLPNSRVIEEIPLTAKMNYVIVWGE